MPNGREIHQHDTPVSLLQGDGCIDGGGGGSNSAPGIEKSKDPGLAGMRGTAQGGGETGEGFDHRLAIGATVQKLTRSRPHSRDNIRRLSQLADRKDRDIPRGGVNHFNRPNSSLRILRVDVHQDDFCPLIEDLAQHRITWAHGKPNVAEHSSGHVGAFNPGIQNYGLFAVLREDGDGYPMHESILAL